MAPATQLGSRSERAGSAFARLLKAKADKGERRQRLTAAKPKRRSSRSGAPAAEANRLLKRTDESTGSSQRSGSGSRTSGS